MTTDQKGRLSDETFDEFLEEQGTLETCEDQSVEEIIAAQIEEAMQMQGLTKT